MKPGVAHRFAALLLLSTVLSSSAVFGQTYLGQRLQILPETQLSKAQQSDIRAIIESDDWVESEDAVPNFSASGEAYWLKLELDPQTESGLLLELANASVDEISCFMLCDGRLVTGVGDGATTRTGQLSLVGTYPTFAIPVGDCQRLTALLRLKSYKSLIVPMRITGPREVQRDSHRRDIFFSFYAGVILVMLLYNLFLYLSVGDRSYMEYTVYILSVGGTQLVLNGYAKWLNVHDYPWVELRLTHFFGVFSGMATIVFAQNFLRLRQYVPWLHKVLWTYFVLYGLALLLTLAGALSMAYNLINFCALAIFLLIPGAVITRRKGYKPAGFFLLAWLVFILAVVIFVLKDVGLIPYNIWTYYALPVGSAIEVVMLSLALASRINQLKRDTAEAREEQLRISRVNEQMVREQNSILEERVAERTEKLKVANSELNQTLEDLQSAQQQLVQNEKLASIGQLTAGIAHELNNPINFVSSSAHSLRRDIDDLNEVVERVKGLDGEDPDLALQQVRTLKRMLEQLDIAFTQQEVAELLHGIEEGAHRTAEIVKGLRIFSRMDGDSFASADVNELIKSTLIILRSNLKEDTQMEVEYADGLPAIDCQPGRVNQVLMNIITNAAQATVATGRDLRERWVRIRTSVVEEVGATWVEVRIADNGVGMDEATQGQIFDPFFTTKAVGDGTGLGLSIVVGILKDHNADISLTSKLGEGTEFLIRFPA